ncbi:hypothetical protein CRE_31063 [Caenorhabditis remanei]|uniref:Uncharacterized protein n=1 Tax=Caenorhabditis remanei TaxID=31234 RepID=E3LUE6_CAERE|nr:hypothetical protein CRE_31063 [Caenorhabditis remanei]
MRLLLLKVSFLLSFFIPNVISQFYRGELEPRYSRKTPFRQQTEIPEPVFGIGHGIRRFNGDKSSREETPLSPFFGERREPGRRNSGREDGRDYEENGDEENRFGGGGRGRGRPFGFGRHGSPEDEEEGQFPGGEHDFKRPNLPDPSVVKERFDKERKEKNDRRGEGEDEEENHQKPSRGRARSGEDEDGNGHKGEEEEEEHRPRRPPPRTKDSYEEEDQSHRRNYRPHHEGPDRERQHHRGHESEDQETENIAETPSKVVGLNMQMVAGVYPKEKKGPVVEDVDKRGGRFVDKPDEREQNKFFRGSEPEGHEDREKGSGREQKPEEPRDRRPARGDSGESEKGGRGEKSEGGDGKEERRHEGKREKSEEQPRREERERGPEEPPRQDQQQQQQQQAPPPPKPQIPPFPAFPKFPSFGGFQPFQPDFPTRSFGGNGGFAGGPWNEPGRPTGRQTAPGEDVGEGEDRSGQDGRRVHQQNASSPSSDNSSANDESTERRHSTGDHGKENERGRKGEERERGEDGRDGREHLESREERKEAEIPEKMKTEQQQPLPGPQGTSPRKEFPTPGRFVTNIRAKKSGEVLDATTSPSTTSTTTPFPPITYPSTTTAAAPATGIMLPTEAIVTKLRSIVNQRIKVA